MDNQKGKSREKEKQKTGKRPAHKKGSQRKK
jgi:hypothetical protein